MLPQRWLLMGALLVALLLSALPVSAQRGEGYWYTVQPGDSWWSISERTGVPVGVLQANNPQAIRPNLWLFRGERLWIPAPVEKQKQQGYWYIVQPGDTWLDLAIRTGVSVSVLKRHNPHAVHPNDWMWAGDRIFIPVQKPQAKPSPKRPPTPTPPPTPEMKPTPSPEPSPQPSPPPTQPPSPTPIPAGPPASSAPPVDVPCPTSLESVDADVARVLMLSEAQETLTAQWLQVCGLLQDAARPVQKADINQDGRDDVAVVVQGTDAPTGMPQDMVLVFLALSEKYAVTFRPSVQGRADLLAFRDVNADGRVDLVWKEETCRGSDCFTTVRVYTWKGPKAKFAAFSEGEIGMANVRVWLEDVDPGNGDEIVLHGGIVRAISAGPQRTWTEIWASRGGAPYQLVSRAYDPSDCLYHWVLDGNRALAEGRVEDAITAFQAVVGDKSLIACWFRPDEETELRTFGWFRLALAYGYLGQSDMVRTVVNQATEVYPDQPYIRALQTWYQAYEKEQNAGKACQALADFVQKNPILWEMLADYGYANPTFGPQDVCPDLSAMYSARTVACPQDVDAALERVAAKLRQQPGDILALDAFARQCGYVTDEFGGVGAHDVDGDGDEDVFIAINVPQGEGVQGVVAALHREGNEYNKVFDKRFAGAVRLFALEDVNQDQATDVVWFTYVCDGAASCAVQVYVYTWLDGGYQEWVDGRPQGRNARVLLEERGPGSGDEIVIHEELPEAVTGAEVPAREYIWTSDAGAPYRLYDVMYDGTLCRRYALHEAEVALITGPRYGWQRAVERFTRVIEDDALVPCAQGDARAGEDAFLRGLAYFHRALAYAYSGVMDKALENVDLLARGAETESAYVPWWRIASAWSDALTASQDVAAACQAALTVAEEYPGLLARLNAYPVPSLLPDRKEGLCPRLLR